MVLLVFGGPLGTPVQHAPGLFMTLPLAVLAVVSLIAGFIETPPALAGVHLFSGFLHSALPSTALVPARESYEGLIELVSAAVVLLGLAVVWRLWRRSDAFTAGAVRSPAGMHLQRWWNAGWGFDRLYDLLFVRPYVYLSQLNRNDVVDRLIDLIAGFFGAAHRLASATQTGRLRSYVAGMAIGAALIIAMAVWL
jgi:NADH-quinone oxidoreductase subunit L